MKSDSNAFVLDCSVTMSWLFADETSNYALSVQEQLQYNIAKVPSIWSLEVINVLCVAERKNRVNKYQSLQFRNLLKELPIVVDLVGVNKSMYEVFDLAREYDLSAYDASYLELAIRESIPIATLDQKLMNAAKLISVELV